MLIAWPYGTILCEKYRSGCDLVVELASQLASLTSSVQPEKLLDHMILTTHHMSVPC